MKKPRRSYLLSRKYSITRILLNFIILRTHSDRNPIKKRSPISKICSQPNSYRRWPTKSQLKLLTTIGGKCPGWRGTSWTRSLKLFWYRHRDHRFSWSLLFHRSQVLTRLQSLGGKLNRRIRRKGLLKSPQVGVPQDGQSSQHKERWTRARQRTASPNLPQTSIAAVIPTPS